MNWTRLLLILLAAVASALLVACSGDGGDSGSTEGAAASEAAEPDITTQPATAEPDGAATESPEDTAAGTCEVGDPDCSAVLDTPGEVDCGTDDVGQAIPESECREYAEDSVLSAVTQFRYRPDEVEVASATYTRWTDNCLGIQGPDDECVEEVTTGYTIVLDTPEGPEEYKATFDGRVKRVVD